MINRILEKSFLQTCVSYQNRSVDGVVTTDPSVLSIIDTIGKYNITGFYRKSNFYMFQVDISADSVAREFLLKVNANFMSNLLTECLDKDKNFTVVYSDFINMLVSSLDGELCEGTYDRSADTAAINRSTIVEYLEASSLLQGGLLVMLYINTIGGMPVK